MSELNVLANTTNFFTSGMTPSKPTEEVKSSGGGGGTRKSKAALIDTDPDADAEDEELVSVTAHTPIGTNNARIHRIGTNKGATETMAMLRRTPGANLMQHSAYARGFNHHSKGSPTQSQGKSSSVEGEDTRAGPLGYGLSLHSNMQTTPAQVTSQATTPVAATHRKALSLESVLERASSNRPDAPFVSSSSSSSSAAAAALVVAATPTSNTLTLITPKPARPTHLSLNTSLQIPDEYRGRTNLYTPAGISLAKNQELNLQVLSGTFSPHTVRLTEALDHLLQEDDEDETLAHITTQSDCHITTDNYKDGTSDGSDKQETTIQDIYSIDSFAESITGMDKIIHDDWDTDTTKIYENGGETDFYGAVTDEGEEFDDDYTSSVGSFFLDPSHEQRQSTATQTLYHPSHNSQQRNQQQNNPLLNISSRTGTYLMISSGDLVQSGCYSSESSMHRHTNSGGSSSIGSGTNSLVFTDGAQKSQSVLMNAFHHHTHSASSSSLGSVQAATVSTSTTDSKTTTRKQESSHGNAFKPTAMLNSSFQRFTRSSSSSTVGSVSAASSHVDGVHGLHTISDDGTLLRSIRSSEGGAFVPTIKPVVGLQTGSSSSSWKPPVPDRAYSVSLSQSSSSSHCHQTTNTSSMTQIAKRNSGRESSSPSLRDEKGQPKISFLKNDVQRATQSHFQQQQTQLRQTPVIIHHHHHHYSNTKDISFYPSYPATHNPMPTVDEQYYYPNPMIHSLPGAPSPQPYYPYSLTYNYEFDLMAQNTMGMLHPAHFSPETVPHAIMSPLTVPSIYTIPSMGGFYHTCASPVPFATQPVMGTQATTATAWPTEVAHSPIPWQPALIRDTGHSPCFPYSDFVLSSSSAGVVSPTPPAAMGPTFTSSWMSADTYGDGNAQNKVMYLHQNPYSNLYPNREQYHQSPSYCDVKVDSNQNWIDRKGPVSDGTVHPQSYQRNLPVTINENMCNSICESHGLKSEIRRKESLASTKISLDNRPWDQNSNKGADTYITGAAPYPNQEKPGKRNIQVLTKRDTAAATDNSQMAQSSVVRTTNQKKNTFNDASCAPMDWSVPVLETSSVRIRPSGPDSLAEPQEAEYGESTTNRAALKSFYYTFRLKEKESLETALLFADQALESKAVPETLFWRVYLELADLNKRKGNVREARIFFNKACDSSPQSPEVWMEYTKFEEERGHITKCSHLLYKGLDACDFNEPLLIRTVKFEEKMSIDNGSRDLTRARELLSRLKSVSLDKSWRALLEGAMLESRAGNLDTARHLFNFLVHHIPWYGPLYIEFHVLERDLGRLHDALMVVERGLKENSRYGPLWFEAFKLCEHLDLQEKNMTLPRLTSMTERALQFISKELIWKVYLEAALAQERAASAANNVLMKDLIANSRKAFVKAVIASPDNMRWKVWLAAARMELSFGDIDVARRICLMSYDVVPSKGRATVIIELARLEDFAGNLDLARALLCKARDEYSSEWKIWLESVNLESRNGKRLRAVKFCIEALKLHSGTGRLWSALAQLLQPDGERVYLSVLETAVTAVPKSGEVWCEVARMFLNPLCPTFNPSSARKFLNYGIKFTPQYGDSFLETLRLDLLEHYVEPVADYFGTKMIGQLENVSHDNPKEFFQTVRKFIRETCVIVNNGEPVGADPSFPCELSTLRNLNGVIGLKSDIELRCRNADPNYGLMWFYCRNSPIDSAQIILQRTKHLIREELAKHCFVYIAAWLRRQAVEILMAKDNNGEQGDRRLTSELRLAVSVEDMLQGEGVNTADNSFSVNDFSTGLVQLQRLSITNRKKCLFGVDSLLAQ